MLLSLAPEIHAAFAEHLKATHMLSDRDMVEAALVACPDGVGSYLSEGAEVTVWENTIDPEWVIKIQKQRLLDTPRDLVPWVNWARWTRKRLLYDALQNGQRAIAVAETVFFDEFLWQHHIGMTLARFIAQYPDTWDAIGGDFIRRRNLLEPIAKQCMDVAFDGAPRRMPETYGDEIAELRRVDAHFYNFAVRLQSHELSPNAVCIHDIYLIDW